MLKELASIKDRNNLAGFIMYDGAHLKAMDMGEVMRYASVCDGIETLRYANGELVPRVSVDADSDVTVNDRQRKRIARNIDKMTLSDYVECDSVVRKQDVDIMIANAGVVLAGSGLALLKADNVCKYVMLTAYFITWHASDKKRLRECLLGIQRDYHSINVASVRDYAGLYVLNIPVTIPSIGFSLMSSLQDTGMHFIWNMGTLDNNDFRFQHFLDNQPLFMRKITKVMKPTESDLESVRSMFRTMNKESEKALRSIGIEFRA